jgi:hypothetical protein
MLGTVDWVRKSRKKQASKQRLILPVQHWKAPEQKSNPFFFITLL